MRQKCMEYGPHHDENQQDCHTKIMFLGMKFWAGNIFTLVMNICDFVKCAHCDFRDFGIDMGI